MTQPQYPQNPQYPQYPQNPRYPQNPPAGAPWPGPPPHPGPHPGAGGAPPWPPQPGPPPPPPRRRRGRKVLLVVLAAVAALVAFSLLRPASEPVRAPETAEVEEAGTLSALDLVAGDCYNTTLAPPAPGTSQPINSVEVVPCTEPHTDQVIEKIVYQVTDGFTEVTGGRADEDCSAAFESLLPAEVFDDPTLAAGQIVPNDAQTWVRNPVVACVVFSEQPISRSLLG